MVPCVLGRNLFEKLLDSRHLACEVTCFEHGLTNLFGEVGGISDFFQEYFEKHVRSLVCFVPQFVNDVIADWN